MVDHWVPREPEAFPHPLTSLVGRERVAATVADLLGCDDVRLLTLTGPGGMGKTRLAIEVAGSLAGEFPDAVSFVALAPIVDPGLVLPTIARAVGLVSGGAGPLVERLSTAIGARRMLLVLDNFEQVAAAAGAVAALLSACSHLKVLATSRVPLRITGEQEFAVPPLGLASMRADASELASSPAVTLFAQRARAVDPGFELNEVNVRVVADICRHLDGVPLGIELAATRVKVLPLDEILARLVTSLDILAGGPRDHPARLRSMRATIAWSYDLLRPRQRALLCWLSPFAADCPLDVAEALAERTRHAEAGVAEPALDVIAALADASLIRREPGLDGRPRLAMLETIRQFALEKLEGCSDRDAAYAWLVSWCFDIAEQASAAYSGAGPGDWNARLQQEHDNFRAALTALRSRGDHPAVLRLATLLAPLWSALGNEREGYRWLADALEAGRQVDPVTRIRALAVAARLANALGDLRRAESLALQGQALAAEVNDEQGMADTVCVLGNVARGLGDGDVARGHYDAALARYRALGDRYGTGYALIQLAKLGDFGTVGRLGDAGDLARATSYCEEALDTYRALENSWGVARALHQLGHLAYRSRRYARAAPLSLEALEVFWQHGNLTEAASPLEDLADVAGATGHGALAARLYGVAEAVRERLGVPMWPIYRAEYEREVSIARASLPHDRFAREWRAGRELTMAAAVDTARALVDVLRRDSPELAGAAPTAAPNETPDLTTREMEVLRLLASGASNRAIADALFISVTTVKGHVRSLMDKIGLRSRTALAAWAHQHDLT